MGTTSTALARVTERGKVVLKKESFTIKEVADAVVDPIDEDQLSSELVPFPDVPKTMTMTDDDYAHLIKLPQVFGGTSMGSRRALSDEEVSAVHQEQETIRAVLKLLEGRDEQIKEMIRHTMDVRAEEEGRAVPKPVKAENHVVVVAATPRDKHGHYILASLGKPMRIPIPGTNLEYSSEFREGGVQISGAELDRLHKDGEITRADYLAMTTEKRVFDEDKAKKAILDDPERLDIIRKISSRTSATTALNIRKTS